MLRISKWNKIKLDVKKNILTVNDLDNNLYDLQFHLFGLK